MCKQRIKLNCDCYTAILATINFVQKRAWAHLRMVSMNVFTNHVYIQYICLNNGGARGVMVIVTG